MENISSTSSTSALIPHKINSESPKNPGNSSTAEKIWPIVLYHFALFDLKNLKNVTSINRKVREYSENHVWTTLFNRQNKKYILKNPIDHSQINHKLMYLQLKQLTIKLEDQTIHKAAENRLCNHHQFHCYARYARSHQNRIP